MPEAAQRFLARMGAVLAERPGLTVVSTTAIAGIVWTINDFLAWKRFGTGGTPPTWAGYYKMTKIRLHHLIHRPNLLDPSPLPGSLDQPAYLKSSLPTRTGPPVQIMPRIMPQRQVPEVITPAARARLHNIVHRLAVAHPDVLEVKPSKTEGFSADGLYAREEAPELSARAREDGLLEREICHVHPADNSLHVWLSGPDARSVIEGGWGQRFPLDFVDKGWTMVYAPRNEDEVDVVERIVRAGVEWVAGLEV